MSDEEDIDLLWKERASAQDQARRSCAYIATVMSQRNAVQGEPWTEAENSHHEDVSQIGCIVWFTRKDVSYGKTSDLHIFDFTPDEASVGVQVPRFLESEKRRQLVALGCDPYQDKYGSPPGLVQVEGCPIRNLNQIKTFVRALTE